MSKYFLLLIAVLISTPDLIAQDAALKKEKIGTHALGIVVGLTSNTGLAYRFQPGAWSAMVNYLPDNGDDFLGMTNFLRLTNRHPSNLFIYQSNGLYFTGGNYFNTESNNRNYDSTHGFGLGIEFRPGRISFSIMGGYGTQNWDNHFITGEASILYLL